MLSAGDLCRFVWVGDSIVILRTITIALALAVGVISSAGRAEVHEQKQDKHLHRPASREDTRPAWSDLTSVHQRILAPLAPTWQQMAPARRKKWIEIAVRYPAMSPEKQQRLRGRMINWVQLSDAERQRARENYKKLQKLPPRKRREAVNEWQRYKESAAPGEQVGSPLESVLTGAEEAEGRAQESGIDHYPRE